MTKRKTVKVKHLLKSKSAHEAHVIAIIKPTGDVSKPIELPAVEGEHALIALPKEAVPKSTWQKIMDWWGDDPQIFKPSEPKAPTDE